nr:hypothetical protein BaRGS_011810 [Batillaria attramentaria]
MNVIQCYAPTNDSDDIDKDRFYSRLQSIVEKYPERDITIMMGDNAKIGADNTGYEDIMGVYPHKNIHKATWVSPDHTTENQIDHICINKKFRRSMQDVRVKRAADVASDHHLVVTRLKLKLKKNWKMEHPGRLKYNTALLRDASKQQEFKVSLSNRFQALQDLLEVEHGTLESKWEGIKEAVTETCQEVLGPKKHQHKEWISADSLSKIKKRKEKKMAVNNSRTRAEKAKAQAGYTEANKQTKRSIKADKRKYMTWLQQQKQQQERTT